MPMPATAPVIGRRYRTRSGAELEVLTVHWDRILVQHATGEIEVIDHDTWRDLILRAADADDLGDGTPGPSMAMSRTDRSTERGAHR